MPAKRKPTDTVQVNLRMKEHLRRRLEAAAKSQQVSLNYEMISRLARSLDSESELRLYQIAQDIEQHWVSFGERFLRLTLEDDLVASVESLTHALEQSLGELESEHVDPAAVAKLRTATSNARNLAFALRHARDAEGRRKAEHEGTAFQTAFGR